MGMSNVIDFVEFRQRKLALRDELSDFVEQTGYTGNLSDDELDTMLRIAYKYWDIDPIHWEQQDLEEFVQITSKSSTDNSL